jgi:hypothetical protein
MQLNPEGYTGFEGHDAHRVWQAIYDTNCFHGKCSNCLMSQLSVANSFLEIYSVGDIFAFVWSTIVSSDSLSQMCFEERVFFRLISGLHAAIAAHVAERFPTTTNRDEMAPSLAVYVYPKVLSLCTTQFLFSCFIFSGLIASWVNILSASRTFILFLFSSRGQ